MTNTRPQLQEDIAESTPNIWDSYHVESDVVHSGEVKKKVIKMLDPE